MNYENGEFDVVQSKKKLTEEQIEAYITHNYKKNSVEYMVVDKFVINTIDYETTKNGND